MSVVFQQLGFSSDHYNLSDGKRCSISRNGISPLDLQGRLAIFYTKFPSNRFLPHASSSSSASVSGSEQWLYPRTQPRKKRIAGVDQEELLDPTLLAYPDSCFCEFKGVQIHHKVFSAESQIPTNSQLPHKIGLPMILFHGFGASVYSWSRVMKRLAGVTASKVLAFDRPAFGLTSRVYSSMHSASVTNDTKALNPYSMAFSVLATLYFIDFLTAEKAILVGHSAGSLVAVNSYFEAPERIAALILVAPAIVAPVLFIRLLKEIEGEEEPKLQ